MSWSRFALLLAGALLLPTAQLQAQEEVLGSWEMSFETGRGSFTQTFAFAMEEGELTGTVESQMGTTELTNVSFEDGTLTFDVTRNFGGNSFTQSYTATVDGDEMTGTIEGGRGGPTEFTAQRAEG
jgi:hypothetical protein